MAYVLELLIRIFIIGFQMDWMLTSKEKKCFRKIRFMNKQGNYSKEQEIFRDLYSIFNINFSTKLNVENIIELVDAAYTYDADNRRINFGRLVGPVIERQILKRVKDHENLVQEG